MIEALFARLAAAVLALPEPVLARLAGAPIVRDGPPLDTQTQLLLRLMALLGAKRLEHMSAPEARAEFDRSTALLAIGGPRMARSEHRSVPGPAEPIPLRIYAPVASPAPRPAIVYFHGGGWVIGGLDTHDRAARELASQSGCIVVSVDYRLAPEHKFPAAVDDAVAAYRWVRENAGAFGGDASRVAVAGDSAGGNLAAVVCQQTRGDRPPDFQALVYPVTDLSRDAASYETFADGFYLTRDLMHWFRDHYLRSANDALDPRASPLLAPDVAGLPPAFVTTAGFDPLRDEGIAYAEQLRAAGVPVIEKRCGRLIHGFFNMPHLITAAGQAFGEAAVALRRALQA